MIELDYELHPSQWTAAERAKIKDYPFAFLETAFVGNQQFTVSETSLGSNSIGIIAFAVTLLLAVKRFDAGETETTFYDLDSPFRVYFKRLGDKVEISNNVPRGPVIVALAEFKQAVLAYVARFRNDLTAEFPELRQNETFLQLLDEHRQAA